MESAEARPQGGASIKQTAVPLQMGAGFWLPDAGKTVPVLESGATSALTSLLGVLECNLCGLSACLEGPCVQSASINISAD